MQIRKSISYFIIFTLCLTLLLPPFKTKAVTNSPLPSKVLVGYWHNFDNGAGYVKLRDVSPNWDVINLSFGEPTSVTSGDIRFTPYKYESNAEFISDVKYLQSKGKKVVLSIGGQNGQVQLSSTAARDKFVQSVCNIIDTYGLDGLDIDFEGHSLYFNPGDKDFRNPTTPVIVNLIDALKEITKKYGSDFVLTMAPETFFVQMGKTFYGGANSLIDSRCGSYLPVIYAMRDELDWLQVQYYNSGSIKDLNGKDQGMGSAEFYASLAHMLLEGFYINNEKNYFFPPLREDQVVIGIPACNYAGNGYVSNAEVEKALNGLMKGGTVGGYTIPKAYPNLRGLMTWSINWDSYTKFAWSDYFRNYLNKLTPPVNTLKAANLSASTITNGSYTLTATIPQYTSATSYELFENNISIAKGTITPGNTAEKTVNTAITNKVTGTYTYNFVLSDGSNKINSNSVTLTVKSPNDPAVLQAATLSVTAVKDGAFTLTAVIPEYNAAISYNLLEGNTVVQSGNLSVNFSSKVTITKEIKDKTPGTYEYTFVVLDEKGNSLISNKVSVTIEKVDATEWVAWKAYKVGDIVSYSGKKYECRQPHTALPGWEPTNVPALWLLVN